MQENGKPDKDIQNINNSPEISHLLKIQSRLVIKNIPGDLSDEKIIEIFTKNFKENEIKKDMLVIKLQKKYALKGRNKICFITVNNFEVRQRLIQFINELELVSQKGVKQKLTVNDCLFQRNYKIEQDPVNNTLANLEHFQKFKEYLEQDKILDFKNEENNLLEGIFDNIDFKGESSTNNNITNPKPQNSTNNEIRKNSSNSNSAKINVPESNSNNNQEKAPKKMMIIKNENPNIKNAFENKEEPKSNEENPNINLDGAEIETVQESQDFYNDRNYNKKGKGGNYKNNDKYNHNDKNDYDYNNYNYNKDKYYDNYDGYNDKYYKNKDRNYNNYDYYGYGGKKGYKGGYDSYNDYDYGKSYKKKNYYKGGYK